MNIQERIEKLRILMKEEGLDSYLIPTTDFHGSEYVNPYFKAREYMSGFTGSAGTLLVTMDDAYLWTDSRYFIQAEDQLKGSGIKLMRIGKDKPFVKGNVGFDARVIPAKEALTYSSFKDIDLVDKIWEDRPEFKTAGSYPIYLDVTGETSDSKIKRLQEKMEADYHLITSLEEIAYLTNRRGMDIMYTPVFYAYMLVSKDGYKVYSEDTYEDIYEDLEKLEGTIQLDMSKVNYALYQRIHCKVLDRKDPASLMMALKNDVEIAATKKAHLKDGIAMVNFLYWLKANIGVLPISEISCADYLELLRSKQLGFKELSFETIAGFKDHGAIVHYAATPSTNYTLSSEGFLLVDSGGQYMDGTTDITRTIALGPITDGMRRDYTAVLKANIALSMAKFDYNATGAKLDEIARAGGLTYGHGTGHGVGHMLSVHEGPQSISAKGTEQKFLAGMITSNEPGIYVEGEYGIRLENEMLCVEKDGHLEFEILTLCPFDKQAIDFDMLTDAELNWLREYHQRVYTALAPHLDEDEKQWLKEQAIL
ncbi:MAG: M24 family metallopeptidase [Clostridia bacterium]|nr:M24 family metallopeptidase [Clostridia bacterium]